MDILYSKKQSPFYHGEIYNVLKHKKISLQLIFKSICFFLFLPLNNRLKFRTAFSYLTIFLVLFSSPISKLFAMNKNAREAFDEAFKESKAGNWRSAAKQYKAARLHADNYVVKANALKKEAEAYRKASLFFKEYKCLKMLVENAPGQINFKKTVEREYEIANLFYEGYRETPYSWMPWIEDDNHAIEIYEAVQGQSPYAKFIPHLLLKLAALHLEKGENEKAEKTYKKIIEDHPNSKVADIAYLDLANIYIQLAKRGDGDGANTKAAKNTLLEFIKKYPKAPEMLWAENSLEKTSEISAERLFDLAKFYNGKGNTNAVKRYIRDILINYPETKVVGKAENLLDSIEMPLYPTVEPFQKKQKASKYQIKSLPTTSRKILVIPANSEDKWLRPITEESIRRDKITKNEYKNKI